MKKLIVQSDFSSDVLINFNEAHMFQIATSAKSNIGCLSMNFYVTHYDTRSV